MHSTSNLEDGYIGSGKRLWNSIRKYGKEKHLFEILEFLPDRDSLKAREKEIINRDFLKDPLCMNIQEGGGGGFVSEEHKQKWIKAGHKKVWEDESFRCRVSQRLSKMLLEKWKDPIYKEKMSDLNSKRFLGKKHSRHSRDKISESMKTKQDGERNSQYGKVWVKKDEESKKIPNEFLDSYLEKGWKRGRKMPKK